MMKNFFEFIGNIVNLVSFISLIIVVYSYFKKNRFLFMERVKLFCQSHEKAFLFFFGITLGLGSYLIVACGGLLLFTCYCANEPIFKLILIGILLVIEAYIFNRMAPPIPKLKMTWE
jgi:hypothetical protein